ncbi:MAG: urease accessory protein UreD [Pararhodobacter sp.]|nr:urease accessory protein UreD [Pararhodobacter sp.]
MPCRFRPDEPRADARAVDRFLGKGGHTHPHQRSLGAAHVTLSLRAGRTTLARLAQRGSAKAIVLSLPPGARRVHPDREQEPPVSGPEVVFLNTSGGLTGGDRLAFSLDLAAGCRVVATTQTAERAYRSSGGVARVRVCHRLGDGAHLDWLPQETLLYESSALDRHTEIRLGREASCLLLEPVVLGRAAMGEMPRTLSFSDHRVITRAGQPVLMEPVMLDSAALAAGPAVLGGARAFASLILVSRGAEAALAPARSELVEPGVIAGASGFDGRLVVRMMAADGWPLRRQIVRLLRLLRQAPLPRVWQMAGGAA